MLNAPARRVPICRLRISGTPHNHQLHASQWHTAIARPIICMQHAVDLDANSCYYSPAASSSGYRLDSHFTNEGTSSAIDEGNEELVRKRGILPSMSEVRSLDSPPASLLVAIRHSTCPAPDSVTRSTDTYLPLTLDFSGPCFSKHPSWCIGRETEVSGVLPRQLYCS